MRGQSPKEGITTTKGPLCLFEGQRAFIVSYVRGRSPLPYQSRASMMVSTRVVVVGLSGVSAP
jgi:hypothetical protein